MKRNGADEKQGTDGYDEEGGEEEKKREKMVLCRKEREERKEKERNGMCGLKSSQNIRKDNPKIMKLPIYPYIKI